ncbi:OLC1v1000755C1 [Oldenlandia corymbosa var. corymbosa]|uniref:OLC1v1000755C1 n=1 Tax=Oldenlandia corymbosa var. corymbosa TaxID=529605 RepID=A0AAV1D3Q0_OLDCO|nr:OLC1v1000755C1 [Oldenlandia corymbosa var. corymbosa]
MFRFSEYITRGERRSSMVSVQDFFKITSTGMAVAKSSSSVNFRFVRRMASLAGMKWQDDIEGYCDTLIGGIGHRNVMTGFGAQCLLVERYPGKGFTRLHDDVVIFSPGKGCWSDPLSRKGHILLVPIQQKVN